MRGSYRLFVRTVVAMVLIGGSSALAGIISPRLSLQQLDP